jgi:hypothetical protein
MMYGEIREIILAMGVAIAGVSCCWALLKGVAYLINKLIEGESYES